MKANPIKIFAQKNQDRKIFHFLLSGEDLLLVLVLGMMVAIPLVEIILRKIFHTGISGASVILRHLVLIAGMLGGVVAARKGRLLALSTLPDFLPGRWSLIARGVNGVFAVSICALLCLGSIIYIQYSREAGKIIAYGIPVWVVTVGSPGWFCRDCPQSAPSFRRESAGEGGDLFRCCRLCSDRYLSPTLPVRSVVPGPYGSRYIRDTGCSNLHSPGGSGVNTLLG